MLSRRKAATKLMATFALASLASAALAGCARTAAPVTIPPANAEQGKTQVATLAAAFSTIIGLFPAGSIPASVKAEVQTLINTLNQHAGQIGGDLVLDPASTIQTIAKVVDAIATVLTPFFPAIGGVATIVEAGVALLPGLLALFGISGAPHAAGVMPPSFALTTLKAAALAA